VTGYLAIKQLNIVSSILSYKIAVGSACAEEPEQASIYVTVC
jgi:hypothetical protein